MSYHDHDNDTYGSLASTCNRCGIEFAYQCDVPRIGWVGVACKPYTPAERFAINRRWVEANPIFADIRYQWAVEGGK